MNCFWSQGILPPKGKPTSITPLALTPRQSEIMKYLAAACPLPVKMISSPSCRKVRVCPPPRGISFVPFQDSSSMEPKLSGSCSKSSSTNEHLFSACPAVVLLGGGRPVCQAGSAELCCCFDSLTHQLPFLPLQFSCLLPRSSHADSHSLLQAKPLQVAQVCHCRNGNQARALLKLRACR